MVDINKTYTKEEFKKLLETKNIGSYFINDTGNFYDTYICAKHDLSDKERELLDDGKLGLFEIANYDQLGEIETEACDRIWFDRSSLDTTSEKVLAAQKEVIAKYGIKPEECDDFYHGYWSGILALCRYLAAGSQVDIEDLRSGDGLLDS